jgi:hypothetical protein
MRVQEWANEIGLSDWAVARIRTFDLLPDYLRTVLKLWNDVFWASLPTFPFVLWWMFDSPPMWIVVGIFIWVFIVAGYYAWREDHLRLVPKITLMFENREPFVQTTPTQLGGFIGPRPASGPDRVYIRVFPQCSTRVRACEPYLLAIYREEDGIWTPTPMNEPCLLTWANRPQTRQLDVEPGIGPYVDVCYIEQGNDQINPCIPNAVRPLRTQNAFQRLATYRFDVQVTNGDPISLRVRPGKQWNRPEVEIVISGNSSN